MSYRSKIYFNEIDLSTLTNVNITNVVLDRLPDVVLNNAKLAKADGARLFSREYGTKTINIIGLITASSRADYLVARNTLLKNTNELEAVLQLPYNNNPIEYTATLNNAIFNDSTGGYGSFDLEFICSDPFGYDRDARTILNGVTNTSASASLTFSESIGGYYKTPTNLIITILAVTGGTGKYISLSNETGKQIIITRTWAVDDQLTIDMKARICRINGVKTDYTGGFWDLDVDDTYITYADNLTTRNISAIATYKRRYL